MLGYKSFLSLSFLGFGITTFSLSCLGRINGQLLNISNKWQGKMVVVFVFIPKKAKHFFHSNHEANSPNMNEAFNSRYLALWILLLFILGGFELWLVGDCFKSINVLFTSPLMCSKKMKFNKFTNAQ